MNANSIGKRLTGAFAVLLLSLPAWSAAGQKEVGEALQAFQNEAFDRGFKIVTKGVKPAEQTPEIQYWMGYCYENGEGTEVDLGQAKVYYASAAKQGSKMADRAYKELLEKEAEAERQKRAKEEAERKKLDEEAAERRRREDEEAERRRREKEIAEKDRRIRELQERDRSGRSLGLATDLPIGFALFAPAQFPLVEADVTGLRLSIFYGRNHDVFGLDIGGLVSVTDGDLMGLEVSGLFNKVGMSSGSLQIGGIANDCTGNFTGLQIAGIANRVRGERFVGAQIGTLNLVSGDMDGLQIGAFNNARNARGLQIGVVNHAESMVGIQIGLINMIDDSPCPCLPIMNMCF